MVELIFKLELIIDRQINIKWENVEKQSTEVMQNIIFADTILKIVSGEFFKLNLKL